MGHSACFVRQRVISRRRAAGYGSVSFLDLLVKLLNLRFSLLPCCRIEEKTFNNVLAALAHSMLSLCHRHTECVNVLPFKAIKRVRIFLTQPTTLRAQKASEVVWVVDVVKLISDFDPEGLG